MSDKIVIDINSKGIKTARRDLDQFQSSLADTNQKINDLNKSEVLISIGAENNKFLQVLDKTNTRLKEFQNAQILAFYAIKSSIDGLINSMYLNLQSFLGRTYRIHIGLEDSSALKQVNVLENRLNNLSVNIDNNTEQKINQPNTVMGADKNKKTQKDQSPVRRKTLKDKVEDVKDYFHQKKQDFKVDPIGTTFSTAIDFIDNVGRFQTIKEGVTSLKKFKKNSSNSPPNISNEGGANKTRAGKRFFKEDGRIRQSAKTAKDFVRDKAPVAKEAIKTYGSNAKSAISSGGTRAASALKSVGGNAKSLVTNNAGRVARGGAVLGRKALTAGTQLVTKLGAAGTAGAAVTVMGVADGAKDIYKGLKADNDYDKKYETTKGAAKVGGTLTGAAIGTAILPGIGTFLGGAIGYFTGKFGGEKAAEKVAGGSEGAAKYADKSENAAIKVAEQNAPVVEKFDEKLATIQNTDERNEAISGFVDKMSETTEALTTLAQDKLDKGEEVPEEVLSYLNAMSTYQTMLQEGNNPNIFGNQPTGQYVDPNAPQTYNQGPTVPGANAEKGTDGMTAPLQLILSGEKEVKDKVEVSAKDFLTKDNVQATVRVDINVIPQVTTQVTGGGKKGNRPKKEFRGGIVGGNVPGFAEGGYVQGGAQLITVAEEGTPEAIIPLGKHRRKRAMELFGQVGSYLQAPGFSPKGFAAGGIVGGSIGGGFGGGMPTVVEVGGVEIKVEAKDGQNLVETIRENKEAISEEIAGVFNAAFKGQFANTPASGGVSA